MAAISVGLAYLAARAAAAGSVAIRSCRNSCSTLSVGLRSRDHCNRSGSKTFQSSSGKIRIPCLGRLEISPLAESILTASRTALRLTPNCVHSSASVGRLSLRSYSPQTMARPSACVMRWDRLLPLSKMAIQVNRSMTDRCRVNLACLCTEHNREPSICMMDRRWFGRAYVRIPYIENTLLCEKSYENDV